MEKLKEENVRLKAKNDESMRVALPRWRHRCGGCLGRGIASVLGLGRDHGSGSGNHSRPLMFREVLTPQAGASHTEKVRLEERGELRLRGTGEPSVQRNTATKKHNIMIHNGVL